MGPRPGKLLARRMLEVAEARLGEEPVLALQGPRTVGKSTLLRLLAKKRRVSVIDLDDLSTREAVAADPALFAAGPSPVCVDEYQHVPALLDAIKSELNRDLRPGRFIVTGSTRYAALPLAAQALTGRMHFLSVLPFSQGEISGIRENLLEALLTRPREAISLGDSSTTRAAYIAKVVAGGFPLALARKTAEARGRWFDDFVRLTLERDVLELSKVRQRRQLPRLLERLASQTGQVLNLRATAAALGMEESTAENYAKLLESVFMVHRLPSWGTTLRARAAAAPKLHVVDSGLAARVLRLTPEKLARQDPTALTQFGHLLETFVVWELIKQASALENLAGWGHWRTHDGDEVDLVVERADGAVVAFEVKAGSRVGSEHLGGLRKLRDAVGDAFVAGVALYTGARSYTSEDRLHVLPVDRLWTHVGGKQGRRVR